jgi:hypothetical protein
MVVLTESWVEPERQLDQPKSMTYRVSSFRQGEEKPTWTKDFASGGTRPAPGVYFWAAQMPDYASSDIQYLQWLGEDILVCAGEKDDVLCLRTGGKTKWKLQRIWEYQRGFIGPSVWSHHIGRFGRDHWDTALDDAGKGDEERTPEERKRADEVRGALAKQREEFNRQFECAIVGGPVIVPSTDKKVGAARGIFVAVAKGPSSPYWGYLSDCIVYEISPEGRVEGMVNLPRMVNGRQFRVVGDGVIWACQQDALAKLAMDTSSGLRFYGGPGGSDLISRVAWYRQYAVPERKAWFKSGKLGDSIAFGARYAFRATGGGFIADKRTKIYSFPISIIDLTTGVDRTAILHVPFEGEFPLPTENVSRTEDATEAMGPYLLGVSYLRVDGEQLEIVLGRKGSAVGLAFDVKALEENRSH